MDEDKKKSDVVQLPVKRGRGRPKGSKNKKGTGIRATTITTEEDLLFHKLFEREKGTGKPLISRTARENIIAVFTKMGGTDQMKRWAMQNQTEFYKLYARLIPVEVTGKDGDAIKFEMAERDEMRNKILEAAATVAQESAVGKLH
jgi:hypothetical protein